ncbi:Na+/H+ antiporter subunit C [Fuscovulum blasticum]|uniref:Na+/H+ antiporter subunit C n=1 Tax=Fuscovulum blasticum TaxID=1075 RepID=UPI000D3E52AE|nr:Na+/H+ antiporter subunit C [Fuscovulum blasticum]AWD22521.1 Na+/H+ antiporter subunit C [Fuscovulum blasticum]
MEALFAIAIGALTFTGVYLMLRLRSFPMILGLTFISYAVNLFLFISGRLRSGAAPIVGTTDTPADPLPQALVLTAIVISFGMTAVIVMMSLGARFEGGDDRVDGGSDGPGNRPEKTQ